MSSYGLKKILITAGYHCRRLIDRGVERQAALQETTEMCAFSMGVVGHDRRLQKLAKAFCSLAPSFSLAWAENAFATISPSHRLAASLMATSIPEEHADSIALPWRCFAIEIPDGLLDEDRGFILVLASRDGGFKCLSLDGAGMGFDVEKSLGGYAKREFINIEIPEDEKDSEDIDDINESEKRLALLRGRIIIGSCIEMMAYRESPSFHDHGGSIRIKNGEPRQYNYQLTRSVKIDARDGIARFVAGERRSSSPTVQVLVRGHYKFQPHGPGGTLRKWIHIEPYWRGPEDAPIATRAHLLDKKE